MSRPPLTRWMVALSALILGAFTTPAAADWLYVSKEGLPHLEEIRKAIAPAPLFRAGEGAQGPWYVRAVIRDVAAALRGRLSHEDLTVYNAAQKLAYLTAIALAVLLVLSGLAIWKPVQLYWLASLMGDYEGARLVHFFSMAGLVLFVLVHVALVILVPKTFLTMITGRLKHG